MTTDKERAEVYRELADELPMDAYWDRSALTHKADLLDPPKPQWADGTVAWVTNSHQRTYLCQWCDTEDNWCIGGPDGDSAPGSVTKVEPLRVLADDEMAVKRFEVDYMGPCDTTAKFMREAADRATKLGHGSNVTRAVRQVLRGYADTLDAEAGEQ